MLDPVRHCQFEFAAVMGAAEIGDDDPQAQAAYDAAFAVLCGTKPLSLDEAAERLRFLSYVGREFIGDAGAQEGIHAAMLQVAAWLTLSATAWRMAA
ncbi:hypothetical protein [Bosea rubneri]|uniref:Uncharacterized protein n=1 Tax=Bosea rubneri TaxID=3075434 RepID=A0ABU3S4A3_9HYPH|nr:hypothetical protein [Bosea sp. ZW T0_25]MDU0339561.1 hypothetical protein [Bosea sp. ZW T0_25]